MRVVSTYVWVAIVAVLSPFATSSTETHGQTFPFGQTQSAASECAALLSAAEAVYFYSGQSKTIASVKLKTEVLEKIRGKEVKSWAHEDFTEIKKQTEQCYMASITPPTMNQFTQEARIIFRDYGRALFQIEQQQQENKLAVTRQKSRVEEEAARQSQREAPAPSAALTQAKQELKALEEQERQVEEQQKLAGVQQEIERKKQEIAKKKAAVEEAPSAEAENDKNAGVLIQGVLGILGGVLNKEKSPSSPKVAAVPPIAAPPSASKSPSDIDAPLFDTAARIMGDNDVAVVIGVEKYQDLPASDYSSSDAKLVKEYLVSLGVRERNIELLLNERATQSSIRKSLESWLPNRVKKDSKVFVYYSGHGAPDPTTGDAYLVPHDGDANYLSTTGYPLKTLYEKLGALPVAEVVVVLDSCFSGAGGRSVLAKGARPLVLMKEGPALAPNMAVLAATQGTQISTSSPEKGHGLLTYYFLKAIKDGKKGLPEIYNSIKPLVEDEAKTLNVSQSPSLNPEPEKLQGKFRLRK